MTFPLIADTGVVKSGGWLDFGQICEFGCQSDGGLKVVQISLDLVRLQLWVLESILGLGRPKTGRNKVSTADQHPKCA